jgi:hypothetical protein
VTVRITSIGFASPTNEESWNGAYGEEDGEPGPSRGTVCDTFRGEAGGSPGGGRVIDPGA